jgi:hypothetical protein
MRSLVRDSTSIVGQSQIHDDHLTVNKLHCKTTTSDHFTLIWNFFLVLTAPVCYHEHTSSVCNGGPTERTTTELDAALKSDDPRRFLCIIYYAPHKNHLESSGHLKEKRYASR